MSKLIELRSARAWPRVLGRVVALGAGLSVLAIAGAAGPVITLNGSSAKSSMKEAGGRNFQFYLAATADAPVRREHGGVDPVKATDMSGTPYRVDVIDLAGWKLGRYRRQGPHLIAMQNPNLTLHMVRLSEHVPQHVPADFTGLVVIDYEPWWALWERTPNTPSTDDVEAFDGDYKDDWRDYIREHRGYLLRGLDAEQEEAVFKRTYEAFVRTFLLATYYKCKSLRPRAQWSFYNYPQVLINSDLTPRGVQGYGDLTHKASRLNDENSWYYDAVDYVTPRIYPSRKILEDWIPSERNPGEISTAVHERWLSSMVRESVRLAKGKPVYPYHSPIFYSPHSFAQEAVGRFQHEEVYRILAENGADGVIIWHAVQDQEKLDLWYQLWENELKPAGINSDRAINGPGGGSASGS